MLSIKNLTKTYPGDSRALRGVSPRIPPVCSAWLARTEQGNRPSTKKTKPAGCAAICRRSRAALEFVVDTKPTLVGIDPYNKLIDRNPDDNLIAVEEKK